MTADRPLRADAQRNRDKLLLAATEAFAQEGAAVALEAVAARAGVGIGTLYRHFPNREALIVEACRHEVESLCSRAATLLAALPPDQALQEWMERFAQYVATKRGMGDALRSTVAGSPLLGETRGRIVDALRLLMAAGAADGSLRDDVAPEDVMRAMGTVWHLPTGPCRQDDVRRLLGLLLDGLRYGARGQVTP
ncbi:MAG: TetR/AcrR family transcriptional regulator [Frankiaceae bacterium]